MSTTPASVPVQTPGSGRCCPMRTAGITMAKMRTRKSSRGVPAADAEKSSDRVGTLGCVDTYARRQLRVRVVVRVVGEEGEHGGARQVGKYRSIRQGYDPAEFCERDGVRVYSIFSSPRAFRLHAAFGAQTCAFIYRRLDSQTRQRHSWRLLLRPSLQAPRASAGS